MNEQARRLKITTTISSTDKEFLDRMHLNASTALGIGIAAIKKAIDIEGNVLVQHGNERGARFHNMTSTGRGDLDNRVDAVTRQRLDSLQRVMDSTPWQSIDDMAAYFGSKATRLHALREVRDEDDSGIP